LTNIFCLIIRFPNRGQVFYDGQKTNRKQQYIWLLVLYLFCIGLPVAKEDLLRLNKPKQPWVDRKSSHGFSFFKAMAAKAMAFLIFRRGTHDHRNEEQSYRKAD
jgi:hypothetical protein